MAGFLFYRRPRLELALECRDEFVRRNTSLSNNTPRVPILISRRLGTIHLTIHDASRCGSFLEDHFEAKALKGSEQLQLLQYEEV